MMTIEEKKELKMMKAIISFAEVMGMKIDIDDENSTDEVEHIEIDYKKKIIKMK